MATPVRRTTRATSRGAATPLPVVNTKTNANYGSTGKVNLLNQMSSKVTIAQAFAQGPAVPGPSITERHEEDDDDDDDDSDDHGEDGQGSDADSMTAEQREAMREPTNLNSFAQAYDNPTRRPSRPVAASGSAVGPSRRPSAQSPQEPARPPRPTLASDSAVGGTRRPSMQPPQGPADPTGPRYPALPPAPRHASSQASSQPTRGPPPPVQQTQAATPVVQQVQPVGPRIRPPRPAVGGPPGGSPGSDPPPGGDPQPAEPSAWSVALLTFPRYLLRNVSALVTGAVILWFLLLVPLPTNLAFRRDEVVRAAKIAAGLPGYEAPPHELERVWLQIRYNSSFLDGVEMPEENIPGQQWAINTMFLARIETLEKNQTKLFSRVDAIEDFLPKAMAVDIVDGELQVKPEFWHALLRKAEGDRSLFDTFMKANEQAVRANIEQVSSGQMRQAIQSQQVINRDAVVQLLEQNNRHFTSQITKLLDDRQGEDRSAARAVAIQVATDIVNERPLDDETRITMLARANLLQNTLRNINTVNYLGHRLGARVDPHLTSPTLRIPTPGRNFFGFTSRHSTALSSVPMHALTDWSEFGECWCAAHSPEHGKAQLAIDLNRYAVPNEFAIENIAPQGTLDIASSPRDFAIWAEAESEEVAARYNQDVLAYYGDYARTPAACLTDQPPSPNAVCIADGTYNIHSPNWVQSFATFVDLEASHFVTKKVIFRFTSNWGAEHTCIYRVRMDGVPADVPERPEPLGHASWLF